MSGNTANTVTDPRSMKTGPANAPNGRRPHGIFSRSLTGRGATLAVVFIVLALAAGVYFAKRSGGDYKTYSNDFNVYYFASRQVLSGRSPYEARLGAWTPYLYPPLLAELMMPLALVPLPVAAYIWYLVNLVALASGAAMSASLACFGQPSKDRPWMFGKDSFLPQYVAGIGCAIVLGRFALDCFAMGQVNPIVTFLAIAHVYFYARDRKGLSAAALAFACVLKITPLLFIIYHLARGRIRYAVVCSALIGSVALVSFAALGGSATTAAGAFYHQTIQNGQGFDLSFSGNQSLRGAEARLFGESGEQSRKTTDPLVAGLSVGFLLVAAWKTRAVGNKGALNEAVVAAPFFCLLVMLSPLSWKNHFVMLLLPVAILICWATTGKREGWKSSLLAILKSAPGAVVVVVFVAFDLTSPVIIGKAGAEWADSHSIVFAATLLICLLMVLSPADPPPFATAKEQAQRKPSEPHSSGDEPILIIAFLSLGCL
jgi:hypothetical protein